MIFKREISEKANEWQVTTDTVDKDYVLGHFLHTLYNFDEYQKLFVFKGGTSLRKCYFPDFRFSEDLDFTLLDKSLVVDKSFFEKIATQCQKATGIRLWVRSVENRQFKNEEKGYKCKISFWGANHNQNEAPPPKERWQSKIEIDISFEEEILSPLAFKKIIHPYSDKDKISLIKIPVYSLTEILMEKIRAFFQRNYNAPRDYFDVWYLLNNVSFENQEEISAMLQEKCLLKNVKIDTTIFKNEAIFKIVSTAWHRSIAHHLPKTKLPDIREVWLYLDKTLFPEFLKIKE